MTFTELRKVKETLNRINKYNQAANAHLKFTAMFSDGDWGTCIKYEILNTEDVEEIITICNNLDLIIFFSRNGIHLQ